METKGNMKVIKTDANLNEFFGIEKKQEKKKIAGLKSSIDWTEEERKTLDEGHEACLDNMPLYQYIKTAVLDKAKADIKEREEINLLRNKNK